MLEQDTVPVGEATRYLGSVPACSRSPLENNLDYDQLQIFVVKVESLVDWFGRFPQERLLVLPRVVLLHNLLEKILFPVVPPATLKLVSFVWRQSHNKPTRNKLLRPLHCPS